MTRPGEHPINSMLLAALVVAGCVAVTVVVCCVAGVLAGGTS